MKKICFIVCLLMAMLGAQANDYGHYYAQLPKAMPVAEVPQVPQLRVSLNQFGGVGDGVTDNTQAFAKAMSYLQKQGGGHLDVTPGIYLTGPIVMKDNIDLHVEKNATILFSPDKADLFRKSTDGKPEDKPEQGISAGKRNNISITGQGIIDGNGRWWRAVKRVKVSDTEWNRFKAMGGTVTKDGKIWYPFNLKKYQNVAATPEEQEKLRTHLIEFTNCNRVLVQGVTVQNSPRFHIVPQRCTNVIIDGVTLRCPWNAQNGDGIDIGSCRNVLIVNNTLDVGDDAICMKAGDGKTGALYGPCANINVQDNVVFRAHGGFVIGSQFTGGIQNVFVHNNTFSGTDVGLRFKSGAGRGGVTTDVYISNIYMTAIEDAAIGFETTYTNNQVGVAVTEAPKVKDFLPEFTDIHFSHVVCRGARIGIRAQGERGMIHGIVIKDAVFYADKATDIGPDCEIKLENVVFKK